MSIEDIISSGGHETLLHYRRHVRVRYWEGISCYFDVDFVDQKKKTLEVLTMI